MRTCLVILFSIVCAVLTTQGQTNAVSPATNSIALAGGYVMDGKHKLEPGDVVSFKIIEDKDKKPVVNLTVTDSSELDVPYIGRVAVADKTCRQVAAELKALLEKDYYFQATVVIGLDSVNKLRGEVFVWGQVRNQGPIQIVFNHDLTLGEAILRTGGFSEYADKKNVKVVRSHGAEGSAKITIQVNMAEVMEKGNVEKDIVLEPGDLIIVPSRLFNL